MFTDLSSVLDNTVRSQAQLLLYCNYVAWGVRRDKRIKIAHHLVQTVVNGKAKESNMPSDGP